MAKLLPLNSNVRLKRNYSKRQRPKLMGPMIGLTGAGKAIVIPNYSNLELRSLVKELGNKIRANRPSSELFKSVEEFKKNRK